MSNNIYALIASENALEIDDLKTFLTEENCKVDVIISAEQKPERTCYDLVVASGELFSRIKINTTNSFVVLYSANAEIDFSQVTCYFSECPTYDDLKSVLRKINRQTMEETFNYEVAHTLYSMGVSSNLKGFRYMCTAVEMVICDREYLTLITKRLYPEIAKKYSATGYAVERAIRHLVDKVYLQNSGTEIFLAMGYKRTRCTNAEFIALVADYVVMRKKLDILG